MIYFYLPPTKTKKQVIKMINEIDKSEGRYPLDFSDAKVAYDDETPLMDVVTKAYKNSTIIIYSMDQIQRVGRLVGVLDDKRFFNVTARIINPHLIFDPNDKASFEMMKAMAKIEGGVIKMPFSTKITDDVLEQMKKQRLDGMSLKQIALYHKVSASSVSRKLQGLRKIVVEEEAADSRDHSFEEFDYGRVVKMFGGECLGASTFIEFLKTHTSAATKDAYCRAMKQFLLFFASEPIKDPLQITSEKGVTFRDALMMQRKQATTIKKYIGVVKNYLNYCLHKGYVARNEFMVIKTPAHDTHELKTNNFSKAQLKKMNETAYALYRDRQGLDAKKRAYRNFMAIFLLSRLGMRSAALLNIKLSDFHEVATGTKLRLIGKKRSHYDVILDEMTDDYVKRYIKNMFEENVTDDAYLLPKSHKTPYQKMTNSHLNAAIYHVQKIAGIGGRFSSHSFRATWASLAYGKVDLKKMQIRLGHKSSRQTLAYVQMCLGQEEAENSFIPVGDFHEIEEESGKWPT